MDSQTDILLYTYILYTTSIRPQFGPRIFRKYLIQFFNTPLLALRLILETKCILCYNENYNIVIEFLNSNLRFMTLRQTRK